MENDKGEIVDLYIPRKCSATNRLMFCKDKGVQINVVKVDESGRVVPGEGISFVISGFVRSMGEGDDALNRLAQRDGIVKSVWSSSR